MFTKRSCQHIKQPVLSGHYFDHPFITVNDNIATKLASLMNFIKEEMHFVQL